MGEFIRSYPFNTDFCGVMMAILTLFSIFTGFWLFDLGTKDNSNFCIGFIINRICMVIGCVVIVAILINLFGWAVFEIEKIFIT